MMKGLGCRMAYGDRIYPVSAEYLTKEEYKAEKKQDMPVTTSDIDEYKNKALVQELAPEVKERIEKKGRKE